MYSENLSLNCSSLKLVYIFSVNPYLGPLQISLGRMVMDIMKFFLLYILVVFAFSCGKWTVKGGRDSARLKYLDDCRQREMFE